MAETFAALVTAHLLGDFVFQTDWMVRHKAQFHVLLAHCIIVTVTTWFLLGILYWPVLLIVFMTHICMDAIKQFVMKDSLKSFLFDQLAHVMVILGLASFFSEIIRGGFWENYGSGRVADWYFAFLCLLSGIILIVPAGGIMIGKATVPFLAEIGDTDIEGLKNGGKYIGWLERLIVMLLIFINQPAGIGFLITAKSILRFGEIKETRQRKVAEYIIIGTFLSFGWALLISTVTQRAIREWLLF